MTRHRAAATEFEGTTYRSRMEARWAVFFKTVEIRYEYEKYTFSFPYFKNPGVIGNVRYTPDFYLPDHHIWIEVKAIDPTPDEKARAQRLCRETGESVFFYIGFPTAGIRGKHGASILEVGPERIKEDFSWDLFYEAGSGLDSVMAWFAYVGDETLFWQGLEAGKKAFRASPPKRQGLWRRT